MPTQRHHHGAMGGSSTSNMPRNGSNGSSRSEFKKYLETEDILWLFLSLVALIQHLSSWTAWIAFFGALGEIFAPSDSSATYWRRPNMHPSSQGMIMAKVLPSVLLLSMGLHSNDAWNSYAVLVALSLFLDNIWAFNMTVMVCYTIYIDSTLISVKSVIFLVLWKIIRKSLEYALSLQSVFTKGEWTVVTAFVAMGFTECLTWKHVNDEQLYQSIALFGLTGCVVGCILVNAVLPKASIWIRIATLIQVPLIGVETTLWYASDTNTNSPHSISWLISFLLETENASVDWSILPTWPRLYWLFYWAATLAITIPLAPVSYANAVITRKWFHLIAVLLFAPVTLAAPRLQSLSYAIALGVLLVMECVRREIPLLNSFYDRYLDVSKDNNQDKVIVSHMALIAGCAAPLWIAECVQLDRQASLFLGLSGVLSLGVGDAMGAVVGTHLGQIPWGQRRTVEGSLAMCVGMAVPCYLLLNEISLWMLAVIFTTLLEAFTVQIDNLVLPLAGAAVILLSER